MRNFYCIDSFAWKKMMQLHDKVKKKNRNNYKMERQTKKSNKFK